jgi:hypothetical protein
MRSEKFKSYVFKLRNDEYHRGYKSGHTDGVIAGHSAQWHEGYNQGLRTQNAIDILNKTVSTSQGVMSIRRLVEHLRLYAQMVEAKDAQIALLQNRNASLQGIIEMLDSDDESGDSE